MTTTALAAVLIAASSLVATAEEATLAIENRPYRIELHLGSDPSARLDVGRRDELAARWRGLVNRFVGPAWDVHLASKASPLVGAGLGRLRAEDVSGFDPSFDKIWLVWVSADPSGAGLAFSGREYDTATRWLGSHQRRTEPSPIDASRAFFLFTLDLFSPSALIVGQEGGRALLKVQGAAIPASDPMGAVVAKGTTFIPLRLVTERDRSIRISRIAFTYLTTDSVEGSIARCAITSAFRDPLSQRVARPNTLTALGIKSGDTPLRFRFVDKTNREPAAGYTLTERPAAEGPVRNVGMTDRSGRITVAPGVARGVVRMRLLAGDSEPLAEFPVMPGESGEEREITVDPLPLASAYQVQIDALRDGIVDQVALRARLERLMESRLEGEDWVGLKALLREYEQLPPASSFGDALKKLKDQATKQSYEETKTIVLTRHLQAQFDELQGLIEGYLNTDAAQAYGEAIRNREKATESPKAKGSSKSATPSGPATPPEPQPGPGPTQRLGEARSDVP